MSKPKRNCQIRLLFFFKKRKCKTSNKKMYFRFGSVHCVCHHLLLITSGYCFIIPIIQEIFLKSQKRYKILHHQNCFNGQVVLLAKLMLQKLQGLVRKTKEKMYAVANGDWMKLVNSLMINFLSVLCIIIFNVWCKHICFQEWVGAICYFLVPRDLFTALFLFNRFPLSNVTGCFVNMSIPKIKVHLEWLSRLLLSTPNYSRYALEKGNFGNFLLLKWQFSGFLGLSTWFFLIPYVISGMQLSWNEKAGK